MPYTGDPTNSATDRVRLIVGDINPDDEVLDDSVYNYLLTTYSNDENKTAIEALKYIVARYAGLADETAGDISIKYSDLYKAAKELLDNLISDPSMSLLAVGTPYAGGINLQDRLLNPSSNPFRLGDYKNCFNRS